MSTKGSTGNIDAKREEFRKYLEKEGVLEYLTKQLVSPSYVLIIFRTLESNEKIIKFYTFKYLFIFIQQVRLYEEADKPSNALDYLKNNFNGKETEVAQLKAENLEKENQELKERVICIKKFDFVSEQTNDINLKNSPIKQKISFDL